MKDKSKEITIKKISDSTLNFYVEMASQGKKWEFFLGNTNSGDQIFLYPFIYHRDTSHYMVLKKIGVVPSGPFAPILTNVPVKDI